MKRDLDEIAKIEKAIKEKYGLQAIQNPKKFWDPEKETKFLEDLKGFYKIRSSQPSKQTIREGFTIKERASPMQKDSNRTCPICEKYSFVLRDDLYMKKYECCHRCYIEYIVGRELRWKNGWRPK